MNIIIANDFGYVNGGGSQVALVGAIALSKRKNKVTLFCSSGPAISILAEAGVKIVCCDQKGILDDPNRLRGTLQGLWNRKAAIKFKKLLKNFNPDNTIIHIHSWTRALSSSIIPVAQKRNFKVVLTNHDYSSSCPNGAFFNYRKNEICRFNPLSFKCIVSKCDKRHSAHKIWRIIRQYFQKYKGGIPDKIKYAITVSEFSKLLLKPYFNNQTQVWFVRNPIPIEKREPATPGKNKAFVSVGRLDPEKGPFLFAKAASWAQITPHFIGEGECRNEVLRICPSARITGWLEYSDVLDTLKKSRVLVLPSLLYETFGLVILEAAALGVPSIVPDECAGADLVKDGQTGLLFRRGDPNDLAEKINLMKDDNLVARLGKNAYEKYWSDPYTPEKHAINLEQIYESILEK